MKENIVEEKSFAFAIRIVHLYKYLSEQKREYVMSKQLLRAGTSIGANICEAQKAQSRADFLAKMYISYKEANETDYWLRLLYKTDYLTEKEYSDIDRDIKELLSILTAITKKM